MFLLMLKTIFMVGISCILWFSVLKFKKTRRYNATRSNLLSLRIYCIANIDMAIVFLSSLISVIKVNIVKSLWSDEQHFLRNINVITEGKRRVIPSRSVSILKQKKIKVFIHSYILKVTTLLTKNKRISE